MLQLCGFNHPKRKQQVPAPFECFEEWDDGVVVTVPACARHARMYTRWMEQWVAGA